MSEEITQSFAKEVLRLGYEVRDLAKERDALKEHIKYLEIELKCETGRWERAMEDNARLKAEAERLESMADENAHLHKGIYSLSLNVVQLKAEVERLRKAGDALEQEVIGCYFEQDDPADSESLRAWRAAKEGKQP